MILYTELCKMKKEFFQDPNEKIEIDAKETKNGEENNQKSAKEDREAKENEEETKSEEK